MKAGWRIVPLGEVVEISSGGTPSKERDDFWKGDIPWVSPKDMKSDIITDSEDHISESAVSGSATRLIKAGALLLVVRSGILARTIPVARAGRDLTINQDIKALTPSAKLDSAFLAHFLRSREPFLLDKVTRGATVHKLDTPVIKALPIPLPPLDEQKRIVSVLDEAFEGLSRARANAEANLADARMLFEASREGYFATKLSSGWRLARLSEIISIKHGFAFKSEHFSDQGDLAVLTPGNFFEHGGFRARGKKQRFYTGEFPKEFLLSPGEVLVAMTEQAPGLLGSCIIVPDDGYYLHNQRLGLLRPLTGTVWNPRFFAHVFNLAALRRNLSDTCSGATVRHTSPDRILANVVPYCDDAEQLERAVEDIDTAEALWANLSNAYQAQINDLEVLRQSLLQKAFSGELT